MKSSGKYISPRRILSSSLSWYCNGWARLRAKKRSHQSLWSMRLSTAERIKREDIPRAVVLALAGRPTSRPSCFGRNAPAAAALFFLSLYLPLAFQTRLIYWHRSTSTTLCYVQDSRLFLSLHLPLSSAGR